MKKTFVLLKELFIQTTQYGVDYPRYKVIKVGYNCRIYTGKSFGYELWLITIGNNVTFSSGVVFSD